MDHKKSTREALNRYYQKQLPTKAKPSRKNKSPEKDLTEKPCVKWMRDSGWNVDIIEAKATYNPKAGKYISSAVRKGYVDCSGNTHMGHSCYVEFKAPGKRSTLRDDQREFLIAKIETNCFACVTDSVKHLSQLFKRWENEADPRERRKLLMKDLPKQKIKEDNEPLFKEI